MRTGFSRATIARAVAAGAVIRVCTGWVATSRASRTGITAVLAGGKLTGASALASRGTWDGLDRRIHVLLPPKGDGSDRHMLSPEAVFVAPRFPTTGLVRHWRNELFLDRTEPDWRASVIDALVLVGRTGSTEQFIACAESALHERTMSLAALPTFRAALPQRLRRYVDGLRSDSGSGLESIARLRFVTLGCRVEIQVEIPGIAPSGRDGAVDFLLDGWLVIEIDGDEYHDPVADRIRNSILVRLGYRWHRFGYHQVLGDWDAVEATVRELLRYPPARMPRAHLG